MDVKVCHNVELDLSESFILGEEPSLQLNGKVKVNGVGVFDDNGRILPLISKYEPPRLYRRVDCLSQAALSDSQRLS